MIHIRWCARLGCISGVGGMLSIVGRCARTHLPAGHAFTPTWRSSGAGSLAVGWSGGALWVVGGCVLAA
eukprot:12880612-Prorocentrum_lima.AAC.1